MTVFQPKPFFCTFGMAVEGARGLVYLLTVKAPQLPSMGTDSAARIINSNMPGEANEWPGASSKMGEKDKVLFYVQVSNIVVSATVHRDPLMSSLIITNIIDYHCEEKKVKRCFKPYQNENCN